MKHLFASEFYRLRKNKSILVTFIIAIILAIILPIFVTIGVAFLEHSLNIDNLGVYGLDQFFSLLGSSNLIVILLIVNIASFSCNDFSYGTIRNKIISGHNRTQVYLVKLIVNLVSSLVIYIVYTLVSLILTSILLGFNANNTVSIVDIKDILVALLVYIFIHISTYTLLTMCSMNHQTSKKSVIWFLVVTYGYSFILEILIMVCDELGIYAPINLLTDLNPLNQLTYISFNELHTDLVLLIIVSNIIYSLGFTLIGIKSFKTKELK